MPTEKQLANLRPPYDSNTAREMQKKSIESYRKNAPKRKALEQIKNEIIEKSFARIYELLEKKEIKEQDLIQIFKSAIDMSGYKKQELNGNGIAPNVIINREMVNVESNN